MNNFLESLGLNFLSLPNPDGYSDDTTSRKKYSFSEIRDIFDKVVSEKKLDDAIAYTSDLLKREEERVDKIESKASALIGFVGIVSTLITGLATLIFGTLKLNLIFAEIVSFSCVYKLS